MRRAFLPLAAGLACFSALGLLPSAEAQNKKNPAKSLDLGLLKQAPKILSFLDEKKHDCIGVLPFEVEKGKRKPSFDAAPLASALPGRLENALLMSMAPDEKSALRILREPAAYAGSQKVGAWTKDPRAFARLFSTAFPVAWGEKKARPTVFLTGTIRNGADHSVTSVEVVGFSKDSWKNGKIETFPVSTFTVKTDRALLRDLGYSFSLPTSVVKRNVSARGRDQDALDSLDGDDSRKASPVVPTDVAGIRFDLWYGDEKQKIRPLGNKDEGAQNSSFTVDDVPADTKIKFGLTRVTDKGGRLGVTVKLNGLSIYQMDDRDSMQCLKWLFDPSDKDKAFAFRGFHMDASGEKVLPFKVLTNEESSARETTMGSRAGWIDIDVFASGEARQDDEQLLVSTKGGSRRGQPARTLADLRDGLLKRNSVAMKKKGTTTPRGLIVYEVDPVEGSRLKEEDSLENPVRIGGISIQYYSRKGE